MSILVVGSVALDTVKTPFGRRCRVLGGSATYFSVAASYFAPVSLVAVVGRDFGAGHRRLLESRGVDLRGLETKPGKTFHWEGEYGWDFSDARSLATQLNVFAHFKPKIPREYRNKKYLFLANIDPELQAAVLDQVSRPRLVACDTMNFWIANKRASLRRLLKKIDLFFLNESEARQLTGTSNLFRAAREIMKLGPRWLIVKKGEHGALLFSSASVFCVPALLLERVVDPTGAGDTFAGGVMGYLARARKVNQATLRRAMVYGSIMAAFTVEDFSLGRLRRLTRADIARRFRQFEKFTCLR